MAMQGSIAVRAAHDRPIVAMAFDVSRRVVYCAAHATDIRAWDLRTCHCSVLSAHKGAITALLFCEGLNLLLSAGLDGYCVLWDDRNYVLQIVNMEVPIYCMHWCSNQSVLAIGLHSSVFLFAVSLQGLVALRRHRHRQVNLDGAAALPPISMNERKRRSPKVDAGDQTALFRQLGPEMCGPAHGHTDIVSAVLVTESGLVVSVSHDHTFCMYDMDRPIDTFVRSPKVHTAAIVSVTHDVVNNWFVTGAFDGSFQVWSSQGKLLERFQGVTDDRTVVAYAPMVHMYWQLGRYGHIHAYDPRGPADVTDFVEESNQLGEHGVANFWVQPYTDTIIGATLANDVVIWKYSQFGAHRTFAGHQGWGEALIVIQLPITEEQRQVLQSRAGDAAQLQSELNASNEHIFTADATGCVLKWTLNREQLCEVYELEATIKLGDKNVLALAYSPELNSIIAGGDDEFIKVCSLSRKQRLSGEVPLPDTLGGHTMRVTGLAVLKEFVLVSVSHDRSVRFWDLHTMKEIERGRKAEAHQAAIAGCHYNPERDELATWALENVAAVWDVSRPHNAKLLFQMETPGEISQVRWVAWKECWLTTSDDDCMRLWSTEGDMIYMFGCDGGSVNALYVDEKHRLVLAAMQDRCIRVFDLDDPVPKARYVGHTELIRGIGYVEELNCYATCSWDKTMRLWQGYYKTDALAQHHRRVLTSRDLSGGLDDRVGSEYEKTNPLVTPRSLQKSKVEDISMSIRRAKVKKANHVLTPEAQLLSKQLDRLDQELLEELQQDAHEAESNVVGSSHSYVKKGPPSAIAIP